MYDYLFNCLGFLTGNPTHRYELCLFQGPRNIDEVYSSRSAAESRMYQICDKYGLRITKVYPDKHFKTYICDNGATFHINRM